MSSKYPPSGSVSSATHFSPSTSLRCHVWPALAENRRELTIPGNPSGDDDSAGYTNLEEWLHGFAADVEGRND